jgi:uncharacterized protein YdhG (YjbR/CyaY superfamily)
MQSEAATVQQYLAELPADRRAAVEAVRKVVLANMDPALEEGMQYGMISWYVPFSVFPQGYHANTKRPLPYACLASQKNHLSLYLMSVYSDGTADEQWFRKAWAQSGKKLDMGKSCIRFKRAEDLALDVIADAFRRVSARDHIATYSTIDPRNRKKAVKRVAKKK